MNKIILVVCEGNSERAYLQELNRFLRENEIPLHFISAVSEGGDFCKVNLCYRKCRKNNKKTTIVVWVDDDIYKRNDRKCGDNYATKPQGIPDFMFNMENFEDFIVMHLLDDKVEAWKAICTREGHFTSPMHAINYVPLLLKHSILPGYKKGTFSECLVIDQGSLDNLRRHNTDSTLPFSSDFAKFMIEEIERARESSR